MGTRSYLRRGRETQRLRLQTQPNSPNQDVARKSPTLDGLMVGVNKTAMPASKVGGGESLLLGNG